MLLASMTDIRERLGFDDMTDINFAATMALESTPPDKNAPTGASLRHWSATTRSKSPPSAATAAFAPPAQGVGVVRAQGL